MLGMLMPSILKMRYEICWSGSGDCSAALASPRTASSSFSALAATRFAAFLLAPLHLLLLLLHDLPLLLALLPLLISLLLDSPLLTLLLNVMDAAP